MRRRRESRASFWRGGKWLKQMVWKSSSRSFSRDCIACSGRVGDAGGWGKEPPAKLVLEGVSDDDYALLWHVKGDAAGGVTGEMDDSEFSGEGDEVTVV